MKHKINQRVIVASSPLGRENTGVIVGVEIRYIVKFDSGLAFLIEEKNISLPPKEES